MRGRDRPTPPLVAAVLAGCAIVGLVAGAVVGSLPSEDGIEDPVVPLADNPWNGAVRAVPLTVVEWSCEAEPSRDAGGNPVQYRAEFAVDGRPESAWRCQGDGAGESVQLDLGGEAEVAELGLIPGYAKIDPVDGTDRYGENRRVTEVRWHFDDGTSVPQTLDPDPGRKKPQVLRIAPTVTSTLTLEIVNTSDAQRNRVAVSEVVVSAPVRG